MVRRTLYPLTPRRIKPNNLTPATDFSLKLPGFSLSVLGYLGGEDSLRYVLKNKETDEVYFVVVFTLLHKDDVDEGEVKGLEAKEGGMHGKMADGGGGFQPGDDDVD